MPPAASTAISSSGPVTAPADPARFHRAMCCSCRPGSAAISPDCVSPTNAPEAGKNTVKAISSPANDLDSAVAASAAANSPPPASTAIR